MKHSKTTEQAKKNIVTDTEPVGHTLSTEENDTPQHNMNPEDFGIDPDDDASDALKQLIERAKMHKQISEEVDQKLNINADIAEREILMKLWADLGDSSYEYYKIMKAVEIFIKALRRVRIVNKMPYPLTVLISNAVMECMKLDLASMKMIEETKTKFGLEE